MWHVIPLYSFTPISFIPVSYIMNTLRATSQFLKIYIPPNQVTCCRNQEAHPAQWFPEVFHGLTLLLWSETFFPCKFCTLFLLKQLVPSSPQAHSAQCGESLEPLPAALIGWSPEL